MHLVKTILTAGLLLSAAAQAHNVLEFPQPENNLEEFYAVEIPTGGIIGYETDAGPGLSSRPLSVDAGGLPGELRLPQAAGRGWRPAGRGVLYPPRRWPRNADCCGNWCWKMIDGGEKDDKIIAVPPVN